MNRTPPGQLPVIPPGKTVLDTMLAEGFQPQPRHQGITVYDAKRERLELLTPDGELRTILVHVSAKEACRFALEARMLFNITLGEAARGINRGA